MCAVNRPIGSKIASVWLIGTCTQWLVKGVACKTTIWLYWLSRSFNTPPIKPIKTEPSFRKLNSSPTKLGMFPPLTFRPVSYVHKPTPCHYPRMNKLHTLPPTQRWVRSMHVHWLHFATLSTHFIQNKTCTSLLRLTLYHAKVAEVSP